MRRAFPAALLFVVGCSKAGDGAKPNENAVPAPSSSMQDARMQDARMPDGGPSARARCGGPAEEPRCALQREMAMMSATLEKADWFSLAEQLDLLSKKPGTAPFPNWVSIARDTRDAARSAELDGVRAGCRSCHQQYTDAWAQRVRGTADDPPVVVALPDAGRDDAGQGLR